jgi:FG-GAP-like repeat
MSAIHFFPRFRRLGAYLLVLCLAAAFGACAQQPAAATPPAPPDGAKPAAAPAPQAATPASPAEAGTATLAAEQTEMAEGGESAPTPGIANLEPPDGKWLKDEAGRDYFVQEVPKVERTYMWLDEKQTKVRIGYGETYDVVSHDDKTFRVKIYRVDQLPPMVKAEVVSADRERVAATYRADVGQEDRLTFLPFERGLPTSGQWRNGFEVADMNGDGSLDIVFGSARKGRRLPNIFLGDGKGDWRLWAEGKFPSLPYDYGDVAVADFNGDRLPDLVLGVHLRGVLLLASDGPGRFKEWGKGLDFEVPGAGGAATGFSSRAVTAADWNGDGRPDVIALGEGPRLAATEASRTAGPVRSFGMVVYLNQGDGTWLRRPDADTVGIFGDDLAVGDLNGDGRLDAVLGSNVLGDREILRFGEAGGGWRVGSLDALRPGGYLQAVEMADFDRDGRPDLLVGYTASELGVWRSGIDVLYNRPDGTWERRPLASEEHREGVFALATGDLDGDGVLDAAALTGSGNTWVFIGDGKGFFRREQTEEIAAPVGGCRGYGLQIADLDGDGFGELVSSFAGESSAMFAPNRCPQQGGVSAWKTQRNDEDQTAAR